MLIPFGDLIREFRLNVTGVLHVGAHECEEELAYREHGVRTIKWLEANPKLVQEQKAKGHDIHQIVCSDVDGKSVPFYITNNGQSSSVLPLGTHQQHYPWIVVSETLTLETKRIDTLFREQQWDWSKYNFLNLDIQGHELSALKGMQGQLAGFLGIYTEVNTEEVYKGAALLPDLDKFLSIFGFERVKTKLENQGKVGWGDAFYLNRTMLEKLAGAAEAKRQAEMPHRHVHAPTWIVYQYPELEQRGRLGNQLFQIAGLYCMALQTPKPYGWKVEFGPPKWRFASAFSNTNRWYQSIKGPEPRRDSIKEWYDEETKCGPHGNLLPQVQKFIEANRSKGIDTQVLRFRGYFQNATMIGEPIRKHLSRLFSVQQPICDAVDQLTAKVGTSKWAALHIRRGDYTTVRGGNSICLDWKFFELAIQQAKTKFGTERFVFFSDDPAYVRSHITEKGEQGNFVLADDLLKQTGPFKVNFSKDELDVLELFWMSTAPVKVLSNSSFSWWAAFLDIREETKDRVFVPSVFFPHQPNSEQVVPFGWIRLAPTWEADVPHCEKEGEKTAESRIVPLGYSIPSSRMISLEANDTKERDILLADLIPGVTETYRFGPGDEETYKTMYRTAKFAITQPKGGFDALRHYEILANGCIPIFRDLHKVPKLCLPYFPKDMVRDANRELLPWKGTTEQKAKEKHYRRMLLEWTHSNLSTEHHARVILKKLFPLDDFVEKDSKPKQFVSVLDAKNNLETLSKPPRRVLLLLGHTGINYFREMTIIGLTQVLGPEQFQEYPKHQILYQSCSLETAGNAYGCGFSYSRELQDDATQDAMRANDQQISRNIRDGVYDWIIYGKVGVDEGASGSIPNLDFWQIVAERHRTHRQNIAFLYGGDAAQRKTSSKQVVDPYRAHTEHLLSHARYGICFVRELLE